MKKPLTPAGIEPVTYRFVAQHLNHSATAVPTRPRYLRDMISGSHGQFRGCAEERGGLIVLRINPKILGLPTPKIVTVPLNYSCYQHLQP